MDVYPNPGCDQKLFVLSQFRFPVQRESNANEALSTIPFAMLIDCTTTAIRLLIHASFCFEILKVCFSLKWGNREDQGVDGKRKKKQEAKRIMHARIETLVTRQRPKRKFPGFKNYSNLIVVNAKSMTLCNSYRKPETNNACTLITTNPSATRNNTVFCLLNSQSLNNKSADFIDYVCKI